jgi:hypothetical protein
MNAPLTSERIDEARFLYKWSLIVNDLIEEDLKLRKAIRMARAAVLNKDYTDDDPKLLKKIIEILSDVSW